MARTDLHIPDLVNRGKWNDYRWGVWGNSFTWWAERGWEAIKYVVIHHSVTTPTTNPKGDVDYIAQIHKNRGFGGIGYHFVITADGTVWYVGDISTMRANVANRNHEVIGICLVGDFTKHNPTDDQILSAHDLAKFLLFDVHMIPNLKGWGDMVGHKNLTATACPGTNWQGVDDSIYERIKNRIPYTPQAEPEPEQPEPLTECLKQVKDLTDKLGEKQEEVQTLDREVARLNTLVADLKAENKELNVEIGKLNKELSDWQSKYDIASSGKKELLDKIEELTESHKDALKHDYREQSAITLLVEVLKRFGIKKGQS